MDCREAILSDEYIDFVWKMDVRAAGSGMAALRVLRTIYQSEHQCVLCTAGGSIR